MTFAKTTKVPIEKTMGEIRKVLAKAGATGFAFADSGNKAFVAFKIANRGIKIKLDLPNVPSEKATMASIKTYDQLCRSKWRALLLVIKAKITSVESGIETFEQAFLPYLVLKDSSTVGEKVIPKIEQLNETPTALLLGL